jgi:hypothetical protein
MYNDQVIFLSRKLNPVQAALYDHGKYYHLVNVISLIQAQSNHIKRLPLHLCLQCTATKVMKFHYSSKLLIT